MTLYACKTLAMCTQIAHNECGWFGSKATMQIMTNSSLSLLLGVVIPTLGIRENYLSMCVEALSSERIYVVLVGPESVREILERKDLHVHDFLVENPADALATSINKAVARIPKSIPFVTWVGDDDIIQTEALLQAIDEVRDNEAVVLVYGNCDYIDESSRFLWENRPGIGAVRWLSLLPQRISQPASAIRNSAWQKVAGLNSIYKLAFDYDMFIRLSRIGNFHYTNKSLASYRWHPNALSVKSRKASVLEAYRVRQNSRSLMLRIMYIPFEIIVVTATYFFGMWMKLRLKKSQ